MKNMSLVKGGAMLDLKNGNRKHPLT